MTTAEAPPPPPSTFTVPWPCLYSEPIPTVKPNSKKDLTPQTHQKTFAQALSNVYDIPLSQLPQPCMKGDHFAIAIPDDEYEAGMEESKFSLHGRIIWPKGSSPVTIDNLRSKLSVLWKSIGRWGVTSIGKGFYDFTFSSLEDLRRVRSMGSWALNPGVLKLFAWTPDFNPSMQQQKTAQVWLRIYGLSQEYWRKKILFAIASSVGTPICTDSITNKPKIERSFGHFVRVLVDLDLSQELRYRVLVERKGFAFFVDFEYENLPDFCTYCHCTGHYVDICKRLKDNKGKQPVIIESKPRQVFVPKEKIPEVVNEVSSSSNRSPADVELEKEINDAIDAHQAAFVDNQQEAQDNNDVFKDADEVNSNEAETDGSFVEATQQLVDVSPSSPASINHDDLVQKDMEFLHRSWANLADEEVNNADQEIIVVQVNMPLINQVIPFTSASNMVPQLVDKDGFQKVLSKSAKKSQKAAAVKSNYPIRSRVGASKSLK